MSTPFFRPAGLMQSDVRKREDGVALCCCLHILGSCAAAWRARERRHSLHTVDVIDTLAEEGEGGEKKVLGKFVLSSETKKIIIIIVSRTRVTSVLVSPIVRDGEAGQATAVLPHSLDLVLHAAPHLGL